MKAPPEAPTLAACDRCGGPGTYEREERSAGNEDGCYEVIVAGCVPCEIRTVDCTGIGAGRQLNKETRHYENTPEISPFEEAAAIWNKNHPCRVVVEAAKCWWHNNNTDRRAQAICLANLMLAVDALRHK